MSEYIPIEEAMGHEITRFICWPRYDEDAARRRLKQLRELGVDSIALGGRHIIQGQPVLGKGHAGIVLKAVKNGEEVALKARRTDSDRKSMRKEAEMLTLANTVGVGPRLHGFSGDFIVMEKITGSYLGEWVNDFQGDLGELKSVIRGLLEKVRKLDLAGLDHGELNRVKRHFIVSEEGPRIIDFESASTNRRLRNVTATSQSIYLNKGFSSRLASHMTLPKAAALIEALSTYKRTLSDEAFSHILKVCSLI